MRRGLVAVALVLAMSAPGCLDQDFGDLIGGPDFESRQAFSETYSFSYTGVLDPMAPPGGPEDLYERGTGSFDVPQETQNLQVHYSITFTSPSPQDLPPELQEVTLSLEGPGADENATITVVTTQSGVWEFAPPTPGPWSLAYAARGQGVISVFAQVFAPVDKA